MSLTLPVDRARWCDIDLVVSLVTATVSPTPLGAWLVPDERQRPVILAGVARMWIEHAMLFGDAFLLRDGTAATVWFHRYRPIPPPPGYGRHLAETCGHHAPRFSLLDQTLAARRPVEAHNHLAFLAVPPGPRRAERAESVLAASHQCMDNLSLPTYAEASSGTHRDLYHRHGYTDRDRFPRPDGATVYSLWRLAPFPTTPPPNAYRYTRQPPKPSRNNRTPGRAPSRQAPDGPTM
ncbi:hypothetical protein ABGB16_31040 [Micromonospora sp. B11E3]|uniref:hypothetical protein n=1 Tax=Micromonospora sp. B11E3 TaxID=3153562 RepID=UPI00325E8FC2